MLASEFSAAFVAFCKILKTAAESLKFCLMNSQLCKFDRWENADAGNSQME